MPRRQLHLEVPTLEGLRERVLDECGPDAEIIAAEKVTVGGIKGFLARRYYEVTVLVPSAGTHYTAHPLASARASGAGSAAGRSKISSPVDAYELDLPARVGIAALLDDADEAEARIQRLAVPEPVVSTASVQFDELMESLSFTEPSATVTVAAVASAPTLLSHTGDLVVLVGIRHDPLRVARSMAVPTGAAVCVGGATIAPGADRVDDRRSAMEARARGVHGDRGTIVAIGLDRAGSGIADLLRSISPDQVWVVVDASRKPEDTAAWVNAVAAAFPVDAMAVLGRQDTSTPESVDALGLPVGWVDGASVG